MVNRVIQCFLFICLYLGVGCDDGRKTDDAGSASVHRSKKDVETAKSMAAEAVWPQVVQIEFRVLDAPGSRVRFEGATNLPAGTNLMLLVTPKSTEGFRGQAKIKVANDGHFISPNFGSSGGIMPGLYEATITMPIASVQPLEVRSLIGSNGENLEGALVEESAVGITVQKSKTFIIGGQKSVGFLEDFSYEILSESVDLNPGSRALHVSISREIVASEIEQLAKVIKERHSEYAKTFIFLYLPGMSMDGGAYATSHFDPDVSVKLMSDPIQDSREGLTTVDGKVIGVWREEGRWSNVTQIIERGNRLFIRKTKSSGEYSEHELVARKTRGQNRLYQKGETLDYVIINQSGDLEYWDDQGLIFTVLKM